MIKSTIFSVLDVETCRPAKGEGQGLVFDVAWKHIDRKGRQYGSGSYIAKDVLSKHLPFFVEKLGDYYQLAYDHDVKPVLFREIANEYNRQIMKLQAMGHKVIFCAYNAQFDSGALGATAKMLGMSSFLQVKLPLLCIWYYWALTCPKTYTAKLTKSGKFYSTTAEDVYKFETHNHSFVEQHVGFADVEAEAEILLKVLNRKKPMPLVSKPDELPGHIFRVANKRLGMC